MRVMSVGISMSLAVLTIASPSRAQICYRITLIQLPETATNGDAVDINESGQVVGWFGPSTDPTNASTRAFIWLPEAAFGEDDLDPLPQGTNELVPTATIRSVANAINQSGYVVGSTSDDSPEEGFVWVPTSFAGLDVRAFNGLGTLTTDEQADSVANGLTDDVSPLIIVGEGSCPAAPEYCERCAFRWDSDNQQIAVLEPGGYEDWLGARANSIAGSTVVGLGLGCSDFLACPTANVNGGIMWPTPSTGTIPMRLATPSELGDSEAEALDINGSGQIVGYAKDASNQCLIRPLLWDNSGTTAVVLPAPSNDQAEALGVSPDSADLKVVGENLTDNRAVMWDGSGYMDLNTLINQTASCLEDGVLIRASAINSAGWIAGQASVSSGQVPVLVMALGDCPQDVTQSGSIGFEDLTTLLNAWGPCPPGTLCRADIDANCNVGFSDLTRLLNVYFETCPTLAPGECLATAAPIPSVNNAGGISPALILVWLIVGGNDALTMGELDPVEVATCITDPSPIGGFICLLDLLQD